MTSLKISFVQICFRLAAFLDFIYWAILEHNKMSENEMLS